MSISDQLRVAVAEAGSVNHVAKAAGVTLSRLQDFAAGGGLNLSNVDKLADFLGVELDSKGKPAADFPDRGRMGQ